MRRQRIFAKPEELAAMYRDGMTLQQIGDRFGVTRERVRQLIAKLGLDASSGGQSVRAMRNFAMAAHDKRIKVEARRARLEAQFGCDFDTLINLGFGEAPSVAQRNCNGSPVDKFLKHKRNASKRGIEWRLTLAEWWRIWTESGKWDQRGRGQGYCMARLGDSGPYSVENVYITTSAQNSRDFYAVAENKRRWRANLVSAIHRKA